MGLTIEDSMDTALKIEHIKMVKSDWQIKESAIELLEADISVVEAMKARSNLVDSDCKVIEDLKKSVWNFWRDWKKN